jgi:membrane protease subunit HflC
MKKNPLMLAIGVVLIVIFFAIFCCGAVRKSTFVVITTFGNPTRKIESPGFYMKWPPPIQQAYTFDQRIQNFENEKLDESLTLDHFNLLTRVYVGWKISDPEAFFPKFKDGSIAEAERQMEGLIRSAKLAVVGRHKLSDFVSTDETQLKFDQIENEILAILQDQVNKKGYGIEIEYLGIKKLEFPENVTQDIFKVMTSERQIQISETQSDGDRQASNIRADANSKSAQMIAAANAEATLLKGQGEKAAQESFVIFQQNPELAKFLLNLDALELALKDRATLIFDERSAPFNLFQGYSTNLNKGK